MNQIVFAFVMPRHCRKRFPINAFFINAQAAPFVLVLEHLMGQLIDAGTGFAGAGVAGDEPAAAKLIAFPSQSAKLGDMAFAQQQKPRGDDEQQNGVSDRKVAQQLG